MRTELFFLGYGRHEWGDIHTWVGFLGIILVMVHLVLNWQWLVKVAASKHIGGSPPVSSRGY